MLPAPSTKTPPGLSRRPSLPGDAALFAFARQSRRPLVALRPPDVFPERRHQAFASRRGIPPVRARRRKAEPDRDDVRLPHVPRRAGLALVVSRARVRTERDAFF